jgi:hypothetical protein
MYLSSGEVRDKKFVVIERSSMLSASLGISNTGHNLLAKLSAP